MRNGLKVTETFVRGERIVMRLFVRLFIGSSFLIAVIVAILWVNSYLEESNSIQGLELSRWAINYDLKAGGQIWSDHMGSYKGGIYWMQDVALLDPGEAKYASSNGKHEWHHGTQALKAQVILARLAVMHMDVPVPANFLEPNWSSLGFQAFRFKLKKYEYGDVLVIPDWFLIVAAVISPTMFLGKQIQGQDRISKGRCPNCGYDLRSSGDRCSECGTPIIKLTRTDKGHAI